MKIATIGAMNVAWWRAVRRFIRGKPEESEQPMTPLERALRERRERRRQAKRHRWPIAGDGDSNG